MNFHLHLGEEWQPLVNWIMGSVTVAAILSWIPSVTALVALVWWCIKLYETKTVQKLFGKEVKDGNE
jgi:hypothetical protein